MPRTFPKQNNPEHNLPECNNPNLFSGIYVKILNPEKGLRKDEVRSRGKAKLGEWGKANLGEGERD